MPKIPLCPEQEDERARRIRGYVKRRVHNPTNVEVVVAKACNEADDRWPPHDPGGLKPLEDLVRYTIRIAANMIGRLLTPPHDLTDGKEPSIVAGDEEEVREAIQHCFDQLNETQRALVLKVAFEGKTIKAVAAELQLKYDDARTRYQQALESLRVCIKGQLDL